MPNTSSGQEKMLGCGSGNRVFALFVRSSSLICHFRFADQGRKHDASDSDKKPDPEKKTATAAARADKQHSATMETEESVVDKKRPDGPVRCLSCGTKCKGNAELYQHKKTNCPKSWSATIATDPTVTKKPSDGQVTCLDCDAKCEDFPKLYEHKRTNCPKTYGDFTRASKLSRPIHCLNCRDATFRTYLELHRHKLNECPLTRPRSAPFECDHCSEQFDSTLKYSHHVTRCPVRQLVLNATERTETPEAEAETESDALDTYALAQNFGLDLNSIKQEVEENADADSADDVMKSDADKQKDAGNHQKGGKGQKSPRSRDKRATPPPMEEENATEPSEFEETFGFKIKEEKLDEFEEQDQSFLMEGSFLDDGDIYQCSSCGDEFPTDAEHEQHVQVCPLRNTMATKDITFTTLGNEQLDDTKHSNEPDADMSDLSKDIFHDHMSSPEFSNQEAAVAMDTSPGNQRSQRSAARKQQEMMRHLDDLQEGITSDDESIVTSSEEWSGDMAEELEAYREITKKAKQLKKRKKNATRSPRSRGDRTKAGNMTSDAGVVTSQKKAGVSLLRNKPNAKETRQDAEKEKTDETPNEIEEKRAFRRIAKKGQGSNKVVSSAVSILDKNKLMLQKGEIFRQKAQGKAVVSILDPEKLDKMRSEQTTCWDCGFRAESRAELDEHKTTCEHVGTIKLITCLDCNESFYTRNELNEHKRSGPCGWNLGRRRETVPPKANTPKKTKPARTQPSGGNTASSGGRQTSDGGKYTQICAKIATDNNNAQQTAENNSTGLVNKTVKVEKTNAQIYFNKSTKTCEHEYCYVCVTCAQRFPMKSDCHLHFIESHPEDLTTHALSFYREQCKRCGLVVKCRHTAVYLCSICR